MNFFKISEEYTINLDNVSLITGDYYKDALNVYFNTTDQEQTIKVSDTKQVVKSLLEIGNFVSLKNGGGWEICIVNVDNIAFFKENQDGCLHIFFNGDLVQSLIVDKENEDIILKGKQEFVEHF